MITDSEMNDAQGVALEILKVADSVGNGMSIEATAFAFMGAAALMIQRRTECTLEQAYSLLRDFAVELAEQ